MEQQTTVGSEPLVEATAIAMGFVARLEQPGGAATRAELAAHGVVGAEPFGIRQTGYVMETSHQIGGQREQFLHIL